MAARIAIKVGTATLTDAKGRLDAAFIGRLVEQVAALRGRGMEVVLVTSGAIAAGLEPAGLERRPQAMADLQAVAAIGQIQLVKVYEALFAEHGLQVGQVLLTRHETTHRQQYLFACRTLERMLEMGAVPIVNENDTTAVDEITFGDNDALAALVGIMVKADLVVMLTDTDGLHTADPRGDESARLLEVVDEVTDEMIESAGGPGSHLGSGGMASKLEAAKMLQKAGIPMVLCNGRRDGVVLDIVAGSPAGTRFTAEQGTLKGRKLWIAFGRHAAGTVVVDDGAKRALVEGGKSLLAAGVTAVRGDFAVGDSVRVEDAQGTEIARGLTGIASEDLERVMGLKTSEVAEVLPDCADKEVVHRDRLVIL